MGYPSRAVRCSASVQATLAGSQTPRSVAFGNDRSGLAEMTHTVTVEFTIEAPTRQQAEEWVEIAVVRPFKHTRRGTGRIVPNPEQKESRA